MSPTTDRLFDDLAGAGDAVRDPDVLASYRHDQAAPGLLPAGMPAAVVRPRTTAEVQHAVRVAVRHGVPVVPRGAGSGLSGGANAIDGCLVISLERMIDIVDVDGPSLVATVQPGLINLQLREAAEREGLFYAPDPASYEFSTIGGNIATNAGGLCCVKYGVTRDALLGLELVLADGRAVRVGRRARKGVPSHESRLRRTDQIGAAAWRDGHRRARCRPAQARGLARRTGGCPRAPPRDQRCA